MERRTKEGDIHCQVVCHAESRTHILEMAKLLLRQADLWQQANKLAVEGFVTEGLGGWGAKPQC